MDKELRSPNRKIGQGILVLGLMAGSFGVGIAVTPLKVAAETRSVSTLLHVYDLVRNEFIDRKVDDNKLEFGAIRGMLDTLDDPYTRFMEPKVFRSMQEERHGAFSGIGIQIGIRDKKLTVIAPIEDTPAYRAGLKSGDLILEVDGKSTQHMAIEEAVSLIRGQRGTKVKLLIERSSGAKPFTLQIVRDNIVTRAIKTKELESGIAYIRLSSFMSEVADQEMREALERFKDKKALVLDLRGNPGGLLPNAVTIGLMFVEKGPIVQIVDREGAKEKLPGEGQLLNNKPIWPKHKPVVVLVDGGSASASEILSGALQDTKTAILVGTKTFGKGLVQTVHALEGGAGLAITTNKYLTAGGNDINKRGIVPDLVVEPMKIAQVPKPLEGEDVPLEERKGWKDLQLDKGVAYLKGKLGIGPVLQIPAKGPQNAQAEKPSLEKTAVLPGVPRLLNFEVRLPFHPNVNNLAGGPKDDEPLRETLGEVSAKLHGLTADQLSKIAKHKEFRIEIVGQAMKNEEAGTGAIRALHVADYVRGFFLNLGINLHSKDIKIEAKEEPEGGVEIKIQLPYGEVLTGN